jgi:hypothetical protein
MEHRLPQTISVPIEPRDHDRLPLYHPSSGVCSSYSCTHFSQQKINTNESLAHTQTSQPQTKATTSCNILNILSYICTTTPLYSRSTRKSKPESSHPMQIPKTPVKLHSHPRSLLKLRSKHSMRSNRAAVVLGSEVAALGRYERVPLGEESNSCSTGSLVKLFALCSSAGR